MGIVLQCELAARGRIQYVIQARDTCVTPYIARQQTSTGFINNMGEQSTQVWLMKYGPDKQFVCFDLIFVCF